MSMATMLRILAATVLLLGLAYLYVEFEAVRIGAISPLGYAGRIVLLAAVVSILMMSAKRTAAARGRADEIKRTF